MVYSGHAKHLDFGGESCGIRILSHSIEETYTLRKVKTQDLIFFIELRTYSKMFRVASWSNTTNDEAKTGEYIFSLVSDVEEPVF